MERSETHIEQECKFYMQFKKDFRLEHGCAGVRLRNSPPRKLFILLKWKYSICDQQQHYNVQKKTVT